MMNSKTQAIGKRLGKKVRGLKASVIDKTSDVLSAPKRAYHGYKSRKYANEANILRNARDMKNVPDFDSKRRPTDGLKYRSAANEIKRRYNRK